MRKCVFLHSFSVRIAVSKLKFTYTQEWNKLFILWARSFAFQALHFAQGHSSLASISQFIDIIQLRYSFFHRIHNSNFFSFPLPSLFQAKIDKILRSLDGFVAATFKNVNFLHILLHAWNWNLFSFERKYSKISSSQIFTVFSSHAY